MNRNQFDHKYSNFNIANAEMERKWRVYEEERMMMEAIEARNNMLFMMQQIPFGSPQDLSENSYVDDYADDYFM